MGIFEPGNSPGTPGERGFPFTSDPWLNFSSERISNNFVGNKARENLKTGITRKQANFFPKNEHFLIPDRTQGVRNVCFQKIWRVLLSCNSRFEICTFTLLWLFYVPLFVPDADNWFADCLAYSALNRWMYIYMITLVWNHFISF